MRLALDGDQAAYRRLLKEISRPVAAFFGRRLGDPVRTDDVLQNFLLKLHLARATYDPSLPFEPWMWAVARSVLIDFLRGEMTLAARLTDVVDAVEEAFETAPPQEGMLALQQALESLSAPQAEALRLVKLDGLSVEQAAARTGTSVGAFKVRTHRAFKALKAAITGGGDDET